MLQEFLKKVFFILIVLETVFASGLEFFPVGFDKANNIRIWQFSKNSQPLGKIKIQGLRDVVGQEGAIEDGNYKYQGSSSNKDSGICTIKNGKLNGPFRLMIFKTGDIIEINYLDNVLHGKYKIYNLRSKKVLREAEYANGRSVFKNNTPN